MTIARRVTALNNMGVQSLQSGRFECAILSFRHAIELVNTLHFESNGITEPYHKLPLIRVPLTFTQEVNMIAVSPSNTVDVFSSAFALPKIQSLSNVALQVPGVILYNLGLAYQMMGLFTQDKSFERLLEAHRCYKLCMAAVFNHRNEGGHIPLDCYAVLCGALTNMGHILSHCCRTNEANGCIKNLETILETTDAFQYLDDEESEFFFSTTLFVQYHHQCNAAPAA